MKLETILWMTKCERNLFLEYHTIFKNRDVCSLILYFHVGWPAFGFLSGFDDDDDDPTISQD
jgi:hypothetical protein